VLLVTLPLVTIDQNYPWGHPEFQSRVVEFSKQFWVGLLSGVFEVWDEKNGFQSVVLVVVASKRLLSFVTIIKPAKFLKPGRFLILVEVMTASFLNGIITNYQLPIINYQLSITNYQLPFLRFKKSDMLF
jgi:hypothetical protein